MLLPLQNKTQLCRASLMSWAKMAPGRGVCGGANGHYICQVFQRNVLILTLTSENIWPPCPEPEGEASTPLPVPGAPSL